MGIQFENILPLFIIISVILILGLDCFIFWKRPYLAPVY